jgi:hypothetical protein
MNCLPTGMLWRNRLRNRGGAVLLALVLILAANGAPAATATPFAKLVERLSEPGGDFGGDNLISNEQSYLHVMPALAAAKVSGGAYIGVGPDQNFAYIAQIKPAVAYIIDIRRDNLLLHLLFKALFAAAPTRVSYLCLLTGRPLPEKPETWADAGIEAIMKHVDSAKPLSDEEQRKIQQGLEARIKEFGVAVTPAEFATIASCRGQFVTAGLGLVFQARGQPLRSYYPNLRTLLRETDREGHALGFLASEAAYQFVSDMQARDLIVPVVGDVSGAQAMRAIAADMKARRLALSGFYISNVEYYLYQGRSFERYAANLREFPRDEHSMVIRSVFPSGGSRNLRQSVPGYYSTSLVQPFGAMLAGLDAGKYRTYRELVQASAQSP